MKWLRRLRRLNWLLALVPAAVILMEVFWFYPWMQLLGRWKVFGQAPLTFGGTLFLIAAGYAFTRFLLGRPWGINRVRSGVILAGLIVVFTVVRSEYAAGYELSDPAWFVHTGRLLLNSFSRPHPLALALPAAAYLWWRGIAYGRAPLNSTSVYTSFVVGIGSFVLLIIIWRAAFGAASLRGLASAVAPQVAAFFFFGLLALAMLNLSAIRRRLGTDETGAGFNRRWLPILLVVAGGIVIISMGVAGLFSPDFMALLTDALNAVFGFFRQLMYYLLIPFGYIAAALFYVVRWIVSLIRSTNPPEFEMPDLGASEEPLETPTGQPIDETILLVLKWALFAVAAVVVIWLLARAVSRFRAARQAPGVDETSESLWSWASFKADLWLFLSAVFGRFRRRRPAPAGAPAGPEPGRDLDEGGRLSIRQIYQRLLWRAALFGLGRRPHETPFEYEARLDRTLPETARPLAELTELYVRTRYGEMEPPRPAVERANRLWQALRPLIRGDGAATGQRRPRRA